MHKIPPPPLHMHIKHGLANMTNVRWVPPHALSQDFYHFSCILITGFISQAISPYIDIYTYLWWLINISLPCFTINKANLCSYVRRICTLFTFNIGTVVLCLHICMIHDSTTIAVCKKIVNLSYFCVFVHIFTVIWIQYHTENTEEIGFFKELSNVLLYLLYYYVCHLVRRCL